MNAQTDSGPTAKDVFVAALRIGDAYERNAYLDRACAGRPELRDEVDRLLVASEGSSPRPLDRAIEQLGLPELPAGPSSSPRIGPCESREPIGEGGTGVDSVAEPLRPVRRTMGDYHILREIGRGGMGIVYEAVQESLGRHVALKVLPTLSLADSAQLIRFRREARAAAQLHHTNIVPVFGVGEHDGTHYYAMQFIQGQPLDEVLRQLQQLRDRQPRVEADTPTVTLTAESAPPPVVVAQSILSGQFARGLSTGGYRGETSDHRPREAVDVTTSVAGGPSGSESVRPRADSSSSSTVLPGREEIFGIGSNRRPYDEGVARVGVQVAEALAYAHEHGILHRDIKPSNLLLDPDGRAWVTDFGLAKSEGDALTNTGDIVGTLRYMAPERFRGVSEARGDVYSLGLTLYEMVALRPAFQSDDCLRLIEQIKSVNPPRPRSLDAHIPRDLETIVLKAIDKDPARRYQTATALAEDLQRFLDDRPIAARRVSQAERFWRLCRRNPVISGLLAMVATLGLILAVAGPIVAVRQSRLAASESEARQAAQDMQHRTRRALYVSDMKVAFQALKDGDFKRLLDRLERHRPGPGEDDLRGWEWSYLYENCRRGLETPSIDHGVPLLATAYSPDGTLIAVADAGGMVTLYDPSTRRPLRSIEAHVGLARGLAFSSDGAILATGGDDRGIRLWNTATGEMVGRPVGLSHVESLAISPDGGRLISAGIHGVVDHAIKEGQPPQTRGLSENQAHAVSFSPDGSLVAAAFHDHSVSLFDPETGEKTLDLEGHKARVLALAFSPDGTLLASGDGDGGVRLRDVSDGRTRGTFTTPGVPLEALAFSPDGATLASSGRDGMVRLWDVNSARPIDALIGHGGAVLSLAFSADGATLASGSSDGTVRLWELGSPLADVPEVLKPIRDSFEDLRVGAFSPDGAILALGGGLPAGDYGSLTLFEMDAMTPLDAVKDHTVWTAAFSPDGKTLATGGQELILCDLSTGNRRAIPDTRDGRLGELAIRDLAFAPDGATLAFAGNDRSVTLLDVPTETLRATLPHSGEVRAVAFAPGGAILAIGGDGPDALRLWDLARGASVSLPGHVSVRGLAFSPNGGILAATHEDGGISIWEVATRERLGILEGHSGWVRSVAFSPDGRTLASGGWDTTVRLWNLATFEELFALSGHDDIISTVAFSPDGAALLSVSTDDTARFWRASTGENGPNDRPGGSAKPRPRLSMPPSSSPPRFDVPRMANSPVADGRVEPGEYGPAFEVRFSANTNLGRIMYARGNLTWGPEDLSYRFSSAYTSEALHLAFEVRDDFIDDARDGWKDAVQQNDDIELFIDGDRVSNDFWWSDRSGSREGFQLLADTNGARSTTSTDFSNADWTSVASLVPGGYVMEFKVPLSLIDTQDGHGFSPAVPGSTLRFNVGIHDVDDSETELYDFGVLWTPHPENLPLPASVGPWGYGEDAWSVELYLVP